MSDVGCVHTFWHVALRQEDLLKYSPCGGWTREGGAGHSCTNRAGQLGLAELGACRVIKYNNRTVVSH